MPVNLFSDAMFGPGKIEHPKSYFVDRDISIDCRGGPIYISERSKWGLNIHTYTVTHSPHPDRFAVTSNRPLIVHADAWICSGVILYNCVIGERAVVSCGSVVSGHDVPSDTMVSGNPARAIAQFDGTRWIYLRNSRPLPRTWGWKGLTE